MKLGSKIDVSKFEVLLFSFSTFMFMVGIGTWIAFPPLFSSSVNNQLTFSQNSDESLGYSAYMMANPPMRNVMRFHFFNITNPDEMIYGGARPELVETGAYAFLESEQKKYIEFNEDKTQMFYQNYKRYQYSPADLDPGLSYEDTIVFPNPTATGAVAAMVDPSINMSRATRIATAIGLLALGEYPIISKKVREVVFEGYNDPLLDIARSPFINTLSMLFNNGKSIIPMHVPNMDKFAYFSGYNNTYDENYWIRTGKNDIDHLGVIESWAGLKELPESFWPTEYARSIRGSDSASFCKTKLEKTDELPFFQSFMCRSFTKKYLEDGVIDGIPSMAYSVQYDDYDTTTEKNAGFRYKNFEKVDYYPEWPGCSDEYCERCTDESCRLCCGRNIVNGTHLLPPGMFPLVCYPGHLDEPPFTVLYSPPHFLYSPHQVHEATSGISPDPEKHRPMVYHHEKLTGTVLQVNYRLQVNMPIINSQHAVSTSQIRNVIVPLFWQEAHAILHDYVYNKLWFGVVFVPKLIAFVKYSCCVIGIFSLVAIGFLRLRRKSSDLLKY